MSRLLLIRHGQASFGAEDYDVLTARGEQQARRLGTRLAAGLAELDFAITGPARRHRDTCRHALDAARAAGMRCPEPIVFNGLDEFPGVELFKLARPNLEKLDSELAAIIRGGLPREPAELERVAKRSTGRLTALWARGDLDHYGLERFDEFDTRVRGALDRITELCGQGVTVAAFTSGGPIAIAVRRALELSVDNTLAVMRACANASLTELRYSKRDFGLTSFNEATG